MTFPSGGGPPPSRRSTEQMADARIREWQIRQNSGSNPAGQESTGRKQGTPLSGKVPPAPPMKDGDLDFGDSEEQVADSDGKGK